MRAAELQREIAAVTVEHQARDWAEVRVRRQEQASEDDRVFDLDWQSDRERLRELLEEAFLAGTKARSHHG